MEVERDSNMGTGETGWNNGLSGGDVAAVVLYFILVLGIGLYVSRHRHIIDIIVLNFHGTNQIVEKNLKDCCSMMAFV